MISVCRGLARGKNRPRDESGTGWDESGTGRDESAAGAPHTSARRSRSASRACSPRRDHAGLNRRAPRCRLQPPTASSNNNCVRGHRAPKRAPPERPNPVSHPAARSAAELLKACGEIRTKCSGPGGQHRNKTETAVVLLHRPTGLSAEASERRSQAENRQVALKRLRLKLALEHRTQATAEPSRLWQSRTRGGRLVVSPSHDDYPALIAEALDQLRAHGFQVAPTADVLGVTGTQLVGLFRKSPLGWVALARHRAIAGLPALK